jgi:hypothetical protein
MESEPDLPHYIEAINENCSGQGSDYIARVRVNEKPITEEERAQISEIVRCFAAGMNFDESFRILYGRLMQSELVTPSEFIMTLYDAAKSAQPDIEKQEEYKL